MLSLNEDQASKVFTLLDDDEIRDLSQNMATLGSVSSKLIEHLLIEFVQQMTTVGSVTGSFENTERYLLKSLGKERVDLIMDEIRGPAGRTMWDKLGNVNEAVLASYLKNEYPQTVAVVISKIKPAHAARVLAQFPESFAMEVIMRMLRMEPVQKDILEGVEKTLRTEFMNNLARTNRRDSHELIAEIFNSMDRNTESRLLTALEESNRDSAERIKALMFTFEDLSRLDASGIQTLLRNVDKQKIAVALKGSSDQVRELFFSNMSERAGKIMKEDMESMGPVRLRDVDEAQAVVVNKAKDLAADGEIVIVEDREEDELIY
jgi:flagellar motor switch protein FliG